MNAVAVENPGPAGRAVNAGAAGEIAEPGAGGGPFSRRLNGVRHGGQCCAEEKG